MKILNFPQNSSDFGDSLYKGSAVEGSRRRQAMRWRAEEAAWCDRGKTRLRRPGPRFSREEIAAATPTLVFLLQAVGSQKYLSGKKEKNSGDKIKHISFYRKPPLREVAINL